MPTDKETRSFKLHRKALRDIIERQAGSLEKAALEATMNSIEAESTIVKIETDFGEESKRLVIEDNGRGIPTREELIAHFETFGTPHDASEKKQWAQFRMGRGQCFAMGKNVWRTCGWRMETDVRSDFESDRDPQYHLENGQEHFQGCRIDIDIYPDKYQGTVERLKALITEQIEFVSTTATFNGEQINRAPGDLKWTHEDSDAYYLFGRGQDLIIYNMGVKCQKVPASIAGVVGVVVSKHQLKVNFARNEVLSDCPVMQRINKVVKANRQKKTRKQQRRLNSYERVAALQDLRDGELPYDDIKSVGLFYTPSGKSLSFRDILNNRLPWSFCESGNQIADKLMQLGQSFCIDESTMEELSYRGASRNFFSWLTRGCHRGPKWDKIEKLWQPFESLRSNFSATTHLIPREKWTKVEKRLVRVLETMDCWDGRSFRIGSSDSYGAWTDGQTCITLAREWVRRHSLTSPWSTAGFFAVLIHELAHDERTDESHIHGETFYRNFHNLVVHGSIDTCGHTGGAFGMMSHFCERMKNAVNEERAEAARRREEKAKESVDKALEGGQKKVAANVVPTPAGRERVARVTKKKIRRLGSRRMPSGAE